MLQFLLYHSNKKIVIIHTRLSQNNSEIIEKIKALNERIRYYNQQYYDESISEITDFEYDLLFHELRDLEQQWPEYKLPDSVTEQVGFKARKNFSSFTHPVLMGSLGNVFSFDELVEFFNKKRSDLNYSWEQLGKFALSLKFDGLAIELIYIDGKLSVGSTRGDGTVGENVTENIRRILSIPATLKAKEMVVVRGELVMKRSDFNELNERLESEDKQEIANPRNLVSGMIRQIDSDGVSPKLQFFAYQLANWEELTSVYEVSSHEKILERLMDWGFNCSDYNKTVPTMDEVKDYLDWAASVRNDLDFEIDGVVIKLDNLSLQKQLGIVGKRPRYSVAWKLPAEIKSTKLLEVEFNLGRTGKVTPVGILEPVKLAGAMIKRVTLHNLNEIRSKDIRIGDWVKIIRSGDVIPKVLSTEVERRTGDEVEINFPTHCPICDSLLRQEDILTYCINENCPAKKYQQMVHFISKEAMNIDGVGKEVIRELIQHKKLNDIADLYQLRGSDFDGFERMGERLKENILSAIAKSKRVSLDRFIFALGINGVGQKMSKILAGRFEKLENILELDELSLKNQLLEMNEIGEKTAVEISSFFNQDNNQKLIEKFINLGLQLVPLTKKAKTESILTDKKILFTGKMNLSRNLAKEMAEQLGAEIVSSVSSKLDYLIVGESPGSKLKKAQELGVKVMSEEDFFKINQN